MKEKNKILLKDFTNWLEIKNYKPRGIEGKLRNAGYFFEYLEDNDFDLFSFTVKNAEDYREYLAVSKNKKGKSRFNPATINGTIAELRVLFKYLISKGSVLKNTFLNIEKMRESFRLPKNILSIEQTGELLEIIKVKDSNDFKFKVVFELLYSTAARISEIENLRKKDIDLTRGFISILDDKNRRDRIAPLCEYTINILKVYESMFSDDDYIFLHGAKRSLNRFMNDRLKSLTKKNDLPFISCHSIRHTIASQLLKKGADLREVQEILGHKRIKNTEIYTRLMHEDLKKIIDEKHPRERSRK